MLKQAVLFDELEKLPPLKENWVRLVHRLIIGDGKGIDDIKQNGLIFNRQAAEVSVLQRGGNYQNLSSMVSVYNENLFWKSMEKDDFANFDNARYADAKLIFDVPLEEFAFLQAYGKYVKGKVDAKYLVGCVKNVNASNPTLTLSEKEVRRAKEKSVSRPNKKVAENNVKLLINSLLNKVKMGDKEYLKEVINQKIADVKSEVVEAFREREEALRVNLSSKVSNSVFNDRNLSR